MPDEFVVDATTGGPKKSVFPNSVGTILDRLREKLSEDVSRPDVMMPVPMRSGIEVSFNPNLTNDQLNEWRNRAGASRKQGLDMIRFSCLVIGNTVTGIYLDGELVTDENDNALTFTSPEILSMVDEERPVPEGIRAFYVNDAHLQSVAIKIVEEAGWGDEIDANPTMG